MISAFRRNKWLGVVLVVLVFSILFVLGTFLHALGSAPGSGSITWKAAGWFAAFFASLGALYGSIAALDARSGVSFGNHPILRMLLGAAFGAAALFPLQDEFSIYWAAAAAGIGAILGGYGWRWARYVDF